MTKDIIRQGKDYIDTGADAYTYSDATGYVVRTATSPEGSWTATQMCSDCKSWKSVSFGSHVPPGAAVVVSVRTGTSEDDVKTKSWRTVTDGETFPTAGPNALLGAFIQVQVVLKAGAEDASPVVYDVTITPHS